MIVQQNYTRYKSILSYLFNNYGKVPPATLKDMKRKVEDFELDPNDPIDLLFVEIDELADIFRLQKNPLTDKQLREIAYVVLEKAKVFKKDLREWNRKEEEDQTWTVFKVHFRNAQQELRTSGDLTVKEAMSKDDLINVVTESINNVLITTNQENENEEKLNAVMKEKDEMKKQFDELKKQMDELKRQPLQQIQPWNNVNNQQYPTGYYQNPSPFIPYNQNANQNNYQRNNRRRNAKYKYVGTGRYCWTHGACDHWGRHCRNKAQGHIDDANFKDTKGGNMNGVRT